MFNQYESQKVNCNYLMWREGDPLGDSTRSRDLQTTARGSHVANMSHKSAARTWFYKGFKNKINSILFELFSLTKTNYFTF